jgi:hypothetical protein
MRPGGSRRASLLDLAFPARKVRRYCSVCPLSRPCKTRDPGLHHSKGLPMRQILRGQWYCSLYVRHICENPYCLPPAIRTDCLTDRKYTVGNLFWNSVP